MAKLQLTLAMGPYDRTLALRLGDVQPEGIELNYLTLESEEIFSRMLTHGDFHVSEMSLGNYLIRWAQGRRDLMAIPAFPSRSFRHYSIYVNAQAGINTVKDLEGKRVGLPSYAQTASIWMRGIFQHYYGVNLETIRWFQAGLEQPGRQEMVKLDLPPQIHLEVVRDRALSPMLEAGDIDAIVSGRMPSCYENRSPQVKRLFPNYKKEEMEYYQKSRIFPIMHTVTIRDDVYQGNSWVAQSLFKAFEEAKRKCLQQIGVTAALRCSLPWLIPAVEEQEEILGPDPFPYGLEANRHTLETYIGYAREQYLIDKVFDPAEMFAPNTIRPSHI